MNKKAIVLVVAIILVAVGFMGYRYFFGVQKVVVDASEQGQKISEFYNPEAFITPFQLKELMEKNADVVVIGSLNPAKANSPISGSFTMWRGDYSAAEGVYNFGGMRNTKEEMEELLSSFGATPNSTIVVYAANSHHDAARLHWQIKMLGHEDVRFLDGGLNAWAGAGYPVGDANPTVEKSNYVAPNYSADTLADADMVKMALEDDEWIIIDTRSADEHTGTSTKGGAAGPGNIPGAVLINWTSNSNEDTTLLTKEELKAIYGDLIDGKNVIVFCQSGVRSAHTLLVLSEVLGAENVYNYDGSWIEWSYMHYELGEVDVESGEK
ncbi:MAG: sulfurtransferase [Alkaliphilus sp.]